MRLFDLLCPRLPVSNPAYPATDAEVEADIRRMIENPAGMERPVLVLAGWRAPAFAARSLARDIQRVTGAEEGRVISVSYHLLRTIPDCAEKALDAAASAFGMADDERTNPVDVVAVSMGGLVARLAAMGIGGRRLGIRTLYTLASPHKGAKLAKLIRPDEAAQDMRPGSEFLARLDGGLQGATYQIVPYAVRRDGWVGERRTTPPGMAPIWVPGRIWCGHLLVWSDRRILADVGRRLRGEEPLGRPGPLPRAASRA